MSAELTRWRAWMSMSICQRYGFDPRGVLVDSAEGERWPLSDDELDAKEDLQAIVDGFRCR